MTKKYTNLNDALTDTAYTPTLSRDYNVATEGQATILNKIQAFVNSNQANYFATVADDIIDATTVPAGTIQAVKLAGEEMTISIVDGDGSNDYSGNVLIDLTTGHNGFTRDAGGLNSYPTSIYDDETNLFGYTSNAGGNYGNEVGAFTYNFIPLMVDSSITGVNSQYNTIMGRGLDGSLANSSYNTCKGNGNKPRFNNGNHNTIDGVKNTYPSGVGQNSYTTAFTSLTGLSNTIQTSSSASGDIINSLSHGTISGSANYVIAPRTIDNSTSQSLNHYNISGLSNSIAIFDGNSHINVSGAFNTLTLTDSSYIDVDNCRSISLKGRIEGVSFRNTYNSKLEVTGTEDNARGYGFENCSGVSVTVATGDGYSTFSNMTNSDFEASGSIEACNISGLEGSLTKNIDRLTFCNVTSSNSLRGGESATSRVSSDYSTVYSSNGCRIPNADYCVVTGKYAIQTTSNYQHSWGNGTDTLTTSNAMRVNCSGSGTAVFIQGTLGNSNADYAELFEVDSTKHESIEGQEKLLSYRRLVCFAQNDDGDVLDTITYADKTNFVNKNKARKLILGITTATPGVLGDMQEDFHKDKLERDIDGKLKTTVNAKGEKKRVINPSYDASLEYIGREKREEWIPVGLIGKLWVKCDNKKVKVGDFVGIGTNGEVRSVKAKQALETDEHFWHVMEVETFGTNLNKQAFVKIFFNGYK